MQNILDYIVSNTWSFLIVFMFFAAMVTVIWFIRPFRKWQYNRAMHIICSIGFFCILMYLVMGPIGYAVNYTHMISNGKHVCLIEQHEQGHGDGGSSTEHRIYVLDMNTGERVYRMGNSYGELLLVRDSFLITFESGGAVAYSLTNGDEVKEWSKEKGFEKFKELKSGVQDINRQSGKYYGKNEAYLTLTANDGKKYYFDLKTEKLLAGEYPPRITKGIYQLTENDIRYEHDGYYKSELYNFETVEGQINKLKYAHYDGTKLEFSETLLAPDFVAVDPDKRIFIVKHFEGLDRKNAILTAITFDLQKKWSVQQKTLEVSDHYNETPEIGCTSLVNHNLLVTFGGFVVYLNGENGQVIWKSRQ